MVRRRGYVDDTNPAEDNLVRTSHSVFLHKHMPNAKYEVWEGGGHALHYQYVDSVTSMWLTQQVP